MRNLIRLSALIRLPLIGWLCINVAGFFIVLSQGVTFDLDFLKAHAAVLAAYRLDHPRFTAVCYFALYLTVTSLSMPGIITLSLAGGALFGLVWGTVLASFASALGGTLAFLMSRRLLRDWVEQRWGQRLAMAESGIARDGPFYLFGLRLIPVIPYFVINLLMGLTHIPTITFYWVSQLGMLPLLMIYVNAGVQLAQMHSLQDLFSPTLLLSLSSIAIFPWLARTMVALVGRYRTVGENQNRAVVPLPKSIARNDQPVIKKNS